MEFFKTCINGCWISSACTTTAPVLNPATGEVLAHVPYGERSAIDGADAANAVQLAYLAWKNVTVLERNPPLHKLKQLMEENRDDLARTIIVESGKTLADPIISISFVSCTPVVKYIYARGTANSKRVQAQGGAKNPVVVLPDADFEITPLIITDRVHGYADQ
ncbi:MAG: aldehyde dehydrogenase family protein [Chitinophagaceae bacterium]